MPNFLGSSPNKNDLFEVRVIKEKAMETQAIIPYSWQGLDYTPSWDDEETGRKEWGTRKYRIFIWGHDHCNDPVVWIVDDYMPHLYVKIEDIVENELELAPAIIEALNSNLMAYVVEQSAKKPYLKSLSKMKSIIQGYIPEKRRPMFYYNTEQHNVYKVFFTLETAMSMCYDYLSSKHIVMPSGTKIAARAYHNGNSDRVPTEEKLMVERNLERCSWMYAPARLVTSEGLTTLDKEYLVSWSNLQLMSDEYAKQLGFPKPSSLSFDSETFSHVFNRFPKATRLKDKMYAAGFKHDVYKNLACKVPETVNYLIVIWDVAKYGELKNHSAQYGKCVYIYCIDEVEFLTQIFRLILRLDPTVIIGYNQLGFDWDYMEQRCEIFGVKVPNLSRIRGWFKTQFIRKTWKKFSSAWPQYPGRFDVDMLYICRIQMKFNNYKLKTVSKALLGHSKVELPYKDQFKIVAANDRDGMSKIMDYLLTDILLPYELYQKLSMSIYLHTNASVMRVNPLDLYTEGQSIRCVCQLYCDVVRENMYINSREIWKAGKYIGGLVFDQIAGIYDDVMTFDFNSLYPSEMKANNICYTTLIEEKKNGSTTKDEECHVVEGPVPIIDKKTKEIISQEYHKFRFISKKTYVGLLPKIVTRLNKLRSDYKKPMAAAGKKVEELGFEMDAAKSMENSQEKDDKIKALQEQISYWQTEYDIWNVKQNAVKTSANSMYGFMGMKTGKYSLIEGGMATTLAGRDALKKTLGIVVGHFGGVLVYGDTDSVMVKFPPEFINTSNYKTKLKEISDYISSQFPEEVNIVPENFFRRFFTITKKRYLAIKINPKNPSVIPTEEEILAKDLLYKKGVISVRGNSCGIVYKNFDPVAVKMLLRIPVDDLLSHLHLICLRIMRREYPLEDYTFSQKLGQDYKNTSSEMAVFSDQLKQKGRSHKAGEELEYVYARTYGDCLVGFKMQAPDLFVENSNILDTMYYITNKIAKPLEQLLTCAYDDTVLKSYEKKIIRPRKPTSVQKVTKHWHLEMYIRKYIAHIHQNWIEVQNSIKWLGLYAEQQGKITYYLDETTTKKAMFDRYGLDWTVHNNEFGVLVPKEYPEPSARKPFKSDYAEI